MAKRKTPAKAKSPALVRQPPISETSEAAAAPSTNQPAASREFPIVGIGASAGGLAAIEAFFSAMPPDTEKGIAFVIIQHLSPDHKSILAELVQRYTAMRVFEVEDGMEIEPSCAYIIPPNHLMTVVGGKLQLLAPELPRVNRHPIDFFFRSLATDQHERAICIVLSGTGSDGTLGIRAVKGEGGMVMVQNPESTEFDGMPRAAIATGMVDYISPPAEMPAQLIAYVNQVGNNRLKAKFVSTREPQDALAQICVLLLAKTGHDFSQYKTNTIARRVERRMALQQIDQITDYVRYMQQNAGEAEALFRDLLIGVTSFFRDPDAFAALQNLAIPAIFKNASRASTVRVWVCGCSTGEEAYSIAILIREYLEQMQQPYKVQIFATDIDRQATDQARVGLFPASIAADVPPERLSRFFTQEADGSYRIQKVVRDLLIFSEQDVLRDPPFSRVDLISCRNLLIYLNTVLQKRLMPLFHYALKQGGILFLGNSETIGEHPALFDVLDRKAKLYRRTSAQQRLQQPFGEFTTKSPEVRSQVAALRSAADQKLDLKHITEQALLLYAAQSAVLVTSRGEALYFHGRTGNYFEPAEGETAANILSMAREGLRRDLTSCLQRAALRKEPVSANGLQVEINGSPLLVNLAVIPIPLQPAASTELFLLILDARPRSETVPASSDALAGATALEARLVHLETEIRSKDEYIQTILEENETSSEELKSSNEEMQSVNEELQSTNEELETSKEELQSLNEELATVNVELQQKVSDLSRANYEMKNLLAGTGVATVFVDQQLCITRFTPTITQIINLIETDVGRPLAHIASNLASYDRLTADAQTVLDNLVPIETEVQTKAGNWYILTIRPYRTLNNVIEGAVITFIDITQRKLTEQKLLESAASLRAADLETVGIVFFKLSGVITAANNAFLHMIGYDRADLEAGKINWDLITPPKWMAHSFKALEELKSTGRTTPYERQYLRKDGSRGAALFAAWRVADGEAVVYIINVADTNRKASAAFPE